MDIGKFLEEKAPLIDKAIEKAKSITNVNPVEPVGARDKFIDYEADNDKEAQHLKMLAFVLKSSEKLSDVIDSSKKASCK